MRSLRYVLILLVALGVGTYYSSLQKTPETASVPEKASDSKEAIPTAAYMQIESAMVRVPAGPNTAAYMKITNTSQVDDKLLSVACVFAGTVELHDHINEDGIMKMRRVDALEIPAGGSLMLTPGGKHIMFFNVLKDALQDGKTVTLTLEFAKAGMIEVQCPVKPIT
ncbi:MAG: copper chaperone PCu(A)C [Alphaproteobacteria bacterium]